MADSEEQENFEKEENQEDNPEDSDEDPCLGSFRHLNKRKDSAPVPLQLQCLLYIVEHLDEIPTSLLSLLPLRIRHQLLLLLPAVDVCKLEGTSVTCGISMDEIWEDLHKHRIVISDDLVEIYSPEIHEFSSREERQERFNISLTWKESYFQSAFSFLFMQDNEIKSVIDCTCDTDHLTFDVLYSTFYMWPDDEDDEELCIIDEYLRKMTSNDLHGLVREDERCYRYTPSRYAKLIEGKSNPLITLIDFANLILNTCFVSIRIFDQSDCLNDVFWSNKKLPELSHPDVIKLFSCVEAVCFCGFPDGIESCEPCTQIFDIIFSTERKDIVKSVVLVNSNGEDDSVGYINRTKLSSLSLEDCDCHSCHFSDILKGQDNLEYFSITNCSLVSSNVPLIIMNIFEMSSIKQVTIASCVSSLSCQQYIVDSFLSSPYSIHLKLENVRSSIKYNEALLEKIDEKVNTIVNGSLTKNVTIANSELSADLVKRIFP